MSSLNEKSDQSIFIELSKYLKNNSKSGITTCLARLKNDSKCYRQFVKDGGLNVLIKLLRSQDLKILNMTLSILANACMISDTREEVIFYSLLMMIKFSLNNILLSFICLFFSFSLS